MLLLRIAYRNLFRQRRRSFFTGMSLMCGYILLSMFMSIEEGSYSNLINIFTSDRTGHIQIHRSGRLDRPNLSRGIQNPAAIEKRVMSLPRVTKASPRISGPALAYADNRSTPVEVLGIDPTKEAALTRLDRKVREGRYLTSSPEEDGVWPILIGAGVARNLHLKVGDEVVLISQGADGSVANDQYRVRGLVGTDDGRERMSVFLPLPAAQEFYSFYGQVHEIALWVGNQKYAEPEARHIQTLLASSQAESDQDLRAVSWQEVEEDFYRAMQTDQQGNFVSLAIILVIVAIGVLNAILMTTLERTREYGVLKAIGTRPAGVFKLIMLEMMMLTVISLAIGSVFAYAINSWFARVGIQMPPMDIGGITYDKIIGSVSMHVMLTPALVTLVTAMFVSLYPAIRSAHLNPVDAMRST